MRILFVPCVLGLALSQAGCGGGSFGIGFGGLDASRPSGLPGSSVLVAGEFDTAGSYNGKYTLTTKPRTGVDACTVSADHGTAGTSIHVDTSDGDKTFVLSVKLDIAADATFEVSCGVTATNDDDPTRISSADAVVLIDTQ
jgi:hypothetical protein